jgi:transcriptional regulator with XRE-family HTH domain
MKQLGKRVRARRQALNLSQEALARRADVSLNLINRVERGETRDPHISTLANIADALSVPVGELIGEAVPLVEAPTSSTSAELPEEERRTIADSIGNLMETLVRRYDREVRDPNSLHFRDPTSATLWLSDVQRERRLIAEWIHQNIPVFKDVLEDKTSKAALLDMVKIAGHLMTFYQVIERAKDRIENLGEADKPAKLRLVEDTAAAEEAINTLPENFRAA